MHVDSNDGVAGKRDSELSPVQKLALKQILASYHRQFTHTTGFVAVRNIGPTVLHDLEEAGFIEIKSGIRCALARPLLKAHDWAQKQNETPPVTRAAQSPFNYAYGSLGEPVEG